MTNNLKTEDEARPIAPEMFTLTLDMDQMAYLIGAVQVYYVSRCEMRKDSFDQKNTNSWRDGLADNEKRAESLLDEIKEQLPDFKWHGRRLWTDK